MGLNHYYIKAKHGYVTPDMTEANLKLSRLAPNKFLAVFCFIIIAVLWIFTILGLHASKNKLDNLPMIMEGIQTLGNVLVIIITAIFFWKDGHLLIEIIKALVILDNDYSLLSQEEYQSLKRKQLRFILMQIFLMLFCAISGIIMYTYVSDAFELGGFRVGVYFNGMLMINAIILTIYAFLEQFKVRYRKLFDILRLEHETLRGKEKMSHKMADDSQERYCFNVYNELWILSRKFNDFANIHVLIQFCVTYMYALTAGFFVVYMQLMTTYYFLFTMGTWTIYILIMTGLPIYLFHSTYTQAENVRMKLSAKHKVRL